MCGFTVHSVFLKTIARVRHSPLYIYYVLLVDGRGKLIDLYTMYSIAKYKSIKHNYVFVYFHLIQ